MARAWSPGELSTLAVIATTFVPGDDGESRAALAAAALDRGADPAQVRQLRLVLRAMESRAVNLALGLGPRPFSSRAAADRERYLLAWATSRVARRRTVFGSLRKLLTFLAYAAAEAGSEGERTSSGAQARLQRIGYRPDRPSLTARPTPIVPDALREAADAGAAPEAPITLDCDVVVVGSGAGGGVVAAALAEAGRAVVVLEAGPFVDEPSMPRTERDAFDRLYLDHGMLATWDGAAMLLAGSAVGGGTLVNWMTTIETPASVREEWARDHGIDGLGDGEAWGRDVAGIEAEMAVGPASCIPAKDGLILRGAAALGWEAAPIRRNSPDCEDCGSCGFGCPRGAKRSGIRAHLARAYEAGARIVPMAQVRSVLLEGGRAVGVEAEVEMPGDGRQGPDGRGPTGRRLRVRARQVVLAAGALRTPAILQRSGLQHPAIGRNLRIHPVSGVLARLSAPVEMWRGPLQGARSIEFIEGRPGRRGYVLESAPAHPGLLALAAPWEGPAAHAALMADAGRLGAILAVTRDGGTGRTTLTRAGRVRIDYRLDGAGVATLRHALGSAARLARAGGADAIVAPGSSPAWFGAEETGEARRTDAAAFDAYLGRLAGFDFRPNRATVFSAHQMGTVRMGSQPREHPCDPGGRVRAGHRDEAVIRGLYVADTSLFPTAVGVNPMLTVMALARRVSRTVLAES